MSWIGTGVSVAGTLGSGFLGAKAAGQVSGAQQNALAAAMAEQKQARDSAVKRLNPYEEFGQGQIGALTGTLASDPLDQYQDPGYKFREQQGMNAVTGTAAGRGMLKSGDTLRALETYGQDMASQEYQNAFNRRQQEANLRSGLVQNLGQSSAIRQGGIETGTAANVSNALMGQNFNLAGGETGAWGNTVGTVGGQAGNALTKYFAK